MANTGRLTHAIARVDLVRSWASGESAARVKTPFPVRSGLQHAVEDLDLVPDFVERRGATGAAVREAAEAATQISRDAVPGLQQSDDIVERLHGLRSQLARIGVEHLGISPDELERAVAVGP